jgi:Helix-turn-helix domain
MAELARLPVVVPGLADVLADPDLLLRLPADVLIALRHQLRVLETDLERILTLRLVRHENPELDDIGVLSPAKLAELWGMPVAKVRELCRAGLIPARKLGPKEWVVPVAALRAWATTGLDKACTATLQSTHETTPGQAAPPPARPYRVEVRRPLGRAPGHRPKVGSGSAARQPDGRAPDAAASAAD